MPDNEQNLNSEQTTLKQEFTTAERKERQARYLKSIQSVLDQLVEVEPQEIKRHEKQFVSDQNKSENLDMVYLAKRLIRSAVAYDLKKNEELDLFFLYEEAGITQNFDDPAYYDHTSVLGDNGPDNPKAPLKQGEQWNKGRRATLTGVQYDLDKDGYPVNPYQKRGMRGRGMFWPYGPSTAVDNGAIKFQDGRMHVTGIIRGDSKLPGFAGGYAVFKQDDQGAFYIDRDVIVDSQVMEFFEEMVSGSIPLEAPEEEVETAYQERLKAFEKKKYEQALRRAKEGEEIQDTGASEFDKKRIRGQVETHFKFEQVKENDPAFLERLRTIIAEGQECFRGPVMNDNRATDSAWCESILSWYNFDDDVWDWVRRGDDNQDPIYPYEFAAGDDAEKLVLHDINPEFIKTACASHGPMAAIMMASYMLDSVKNGTDNIDTRFLSQVNENIDFLEKETSLDAYVPGMKDDFFETYKKEKAISPKPRSKRLRRLRRRPS